jgi:hypothetical protein
MRMPYVSPQELLVALPQQKNLRLAESHQPVRLNVSVLVVVNCNPVRTPDG